MRYSNSFGFWEINPFPGSNQICVFNHAFVYPQFRGKGYGKVLHGERLFQARELGYDLAMCTCKMDNVPQVKILSYFKWSPTTSFTSTETGNVITIWTKELK